MAYLDCTKLAVYVVTCVLLATLDGPDKFNLFPKTKVKDTNASVLPGSTSITKKTAN